MPEPSDANPTAEGPQASQVSPLPQPFPQPFPQPLPEPFPFPPDWWRCLRFGPVSGRYAGDMTAPAAGRSYLDLRVDIDPRGSISPILNLVSGDIFFKSRLTFPGRPPFVIQAYIESWIVDEPQVSWSRCFVDITGEVRYWKGGHPPTEISIRIPWDTFQPAGPASVTFTEARGASRSYTCQRLSPWFRELEMEIAVCASVNQPPLLPSYDTTWHNNRPSDTPQRVLTIETAYRESGINVTIPPTHTVVDDSAPQFTSWSAAELHDAMETHFSAFTGAWPKWHMWGLLAGRFDNPGVGGIMFDAAAAFGGAGRAPERQGYAVFRNHSWFDDLVAGTPQNQDQAWAMRHYLYTWVHEAGHAFNFLHSWNKARPDALSWMNYDWRYDSRNGTDSFWGNFRFQFDTPELVQMRHGDRSSVIMGGDPWSSGGHIETPAMAMAESFGEAPLELLVRSNGYFAMMDPPHCEIRLRNLLPDIPITIDKRLSPEFGPIAIFIQKPDGTIVEYEPNMCALGTPELIDLAPANAGDGSDRYSKEVFLAYGSDGFYFDQPGEYRIRAVYQGTGDFIVTSNLHRIRIGSPASPELDRLAQDFFAHDVGLALYLQGSQSPFLRHGMEVIEDVAERCKGTILGAKLAVVLANSASQPFFRMRSPTDPTLAQHSDADPRRALALTEPALDLLHREPVKELNHLYGRVVRRRATYHQAAGDPEAARKELATLREDLDDRDVNASVLERYRALEDSIED